MATKELAATLAPAALRAARERLDASKTALAAHRCCSVST